MPLSAADPQMIGILAALNGIGFVAGSAARRMILGDDAVPPNDIDIFLYRPEGQPDAVRALTDFGYKEKVRRLAITFERYSVGAKFLPVQIVLPVKDTYQQTYGEPATVLAQFAFTVQQFAVEFDAGIVKATYSPLGIDDDYRRILRNVNPRGLGSPLLRFWSAQKYIARGYRMLPEEAADLLDAWADRSLEYRDAERRNARSVGLETYTARNLNA